MKRRLFRLVGLLLASSALMLPVASSASAAPALGLMWTGAGEVTERPEEWGVIERSGASVFRLAINRAWWARGAPTQSYDKAFEQAALHNITILPYLTGRQTESKKGFPTNDALNGPEYNDWYDWAKEVVKRYGYNGTFWSGKPFYKPVTAWEIWNEPNLPQENPSEVVQPSLYADFLVHMAQGVHAASLEQSGTPTQVLMGSLYLGVVGQNAVKYDKYLTYLYENPNIYNAYEGLGIHPYGFEEGVPPGKKGAGEATTEVVKVREALNSKKWGPSRSLWITELGWHLAGKGQPPVKDEDEQARLLNESFTWVKANATAMNIQSLIWYNYRDNDLSDNWAYSCGLRDQVGHFRRSWYAFQEQAGKPRWPNPTVAFQANTGNLFTYTKSGGASNTLLGMQSGTSPSLGQYNGSFKVAFQANTGSLFTYDPATGSANTGYGMKAGTSPSITSEEGSHIAFQADTGNLWIHNPGAGAFNTGYGMKAGTSPSITKMPPLSYQKATYQVAFQANSGELYLYRPGGYVGSTGYGMAPGTSPSIATLPGSSTSHHFVIAFQANTGSLWYYESEGSVYDTKLGMKAGTSPSITTLGNGKVAVVFQANNGEFWLYEPGGTVAGTGLGMQAATSPSVAAVSDALYHRPYQAAFHAGTGSLWTYEPGGAINNTLYGNQSGTSPSIGAG